MSSLGVTIDRQSGRLPPEERRAQIIRAAAQFFAEHGFDGSTRALAAEMGVTQPLIYRHFKTKEDLIEAVFKDVFFSRWNPEWETLISDWSLSLEERLIALYVDYARTIIESIWIRLFMYAGLHGVPTHKRYLNLVDERIIEPIVHAMRREYGLGQDNQSPATRAEMDLVWQLHGAIFSIGIKRYVFGSKSTIPLADLVESAVRTYLQGAPATLRGLHQAG
ncbi:TetR/AcrR family transcriptional regulator [uncultured Erythrobacter sp.]|uniref:TetR/AcrR family transcriptional regulator n=1 Tax=uncultured Erythrobacter sp. TaxID=263913 RepID=UPI0026140502|nr:TetR/AcrR family transcriptional regulator [uncultured Erythrobacter sp.]